MTRVEQGALVSFGAGLVIALSIALGAYLKNPQSPTDYCRSTCAVLDMDYVTTERCVCVCKDVDGTVHTEPVPECP